MNEELKPLIDKLKANTEALHINKVPKPSKDLFKQMADEKFDGNYGALLVYLIDSYFDKVVYQSIVNRMDSIDSRLKAIEGGPQMEGCVELLNGRIIRTKAGA